MYMVQNGTQKYYKSTRVFNCTICDYKCFNKSNLNKHLQTKKHKKAEMVHNGTQNYYKSTTPSLDWECPCGKKYKYRSGFYRHKRLCKFQDNKEQKENINLKNMFIHVVEENKELRNMLIKQHDQIEDIIPKIGNITNNTFNINIFLNKTCKDALNLTEFINSLNIQVSDLEHTKKYGLCQGLTSILVNGLKELGTYKRPIHCTDIKREVLYIKDNNEWGKEETSDNLKKTLHDVADKQRKSIKQWEEANPYWEKSEEGKEQWILLVKNVMGTIDNNIIDNNNIIKNIAKEIKI